MAIHRKVGHATLPLENVTNNSLCNKVSEMFLIPRITFPGGIDWIGIVVTDHLNVFENSNRQGSRPNLQAIMPDRRFSVNPQAKNGLMQRKSRCRLGPVDGAHVEGW